MADQDAVLREIVDELRVDFPTRLAPGSLLARDVEDALCRTWDAALEHAAGIAQVESDNHIDRSEACDCAEKIRQQKSSTTGGKGS